MTTNDKSFSRRISLPLASVTLVSVVILAFLFLQTIATSAILCPFKCDPSFWPFMTYPMYERAHYEGDRWHQPHLFGILEDYSEVEIQAEEMGAQYVVYAHFLYALQTDDQARLEKYVQVYQDRSNQKLIGLRLEHHSFELSKQGFLAAPPKVVKELWLQVEQEKKP